MYNKSYTELSSLETFEERFKYLQIHGNVGQDTFGFTRYLNQNLYKSTEWKRVRSAVIVRDCGNDLGCNGKPIFGQILVHHINPITQEDIINHSEKLFDMDNLICVSLETHNAIHYGDDSILQKYDYSERTPGDTCLWKGVDYGKR